MIPGNRSFKEKLKSLSNTPISVIEEKSLVYDEESFDEESFDESDDESFEKESDEESNEQKEEEEEDEEEEEEGEEEEEEEEEGERGGRERRPALPCSKRHPSLLLALATSENPSFSPSRLQGTGPPPCLWPLGVRSRPKRPQERRRTPRSTCSSLSLYRHRRRDGNNKKKHSPP